MEECFTVQEAAQILKCSPYMVRKLIADDKLRAFDMGHDGYHSWRITRSAIEEFQARKDNGNLKPMPVEERPKLVVRRHMKRLGEVG